MNMKRLIALAVLLACSLQLGAKTPELKFGPDGQFKILQLSDLHLRQVGMREETDKVFARIDFLVGLEKPDLIVITGDLVYEKPCTPGITRLVSTLDGYGIPWCVVYGNHDAEQDLSRPAMSALYASGKWSLDQLDGDGELADVELPVMSSKGDGTAPWYVYCMDSNDYSTIEGVSGYGWFTPAQVQWMRDCCAARTSGKGEVSPSLAFFHIPLCEYVDAWSPQENPRKGMANSKVGVGIRGENIACGALNTGMFAAMCEGRSVVGTFAGHDHDSDFVTAYQGISLCYGRFTGCNSVYNNLLPGGRVILVREGERTFETWERDEDGRCLNHVRFNGKDIDKQPGKPKGTPYGTKTEF